ncbi:fas-binding factor 1 homolog isoform X2 [Xyrauchen texanus]|uniref:fas-binding factor 1 homolog isoform X2 n=1 Tax=Xyrauchen texanus TaxID=154827 RepID=UPI002241D0CC|nr:fas-binding factor 1 homolog isoform X2 [Xyrauchen texanus]
MTSSQKKGLRGSIDDVLGDLLGDNERPVKVRSPAVGSSRTAGVLTSSHSGKKSLLDDDFFSKLAEEAERDDEGSDVSEADPAALLESMKNIDDMDADLFLSKKKPSSAPVQRIDSELKGEPSKSGDKAKDTEGRVIEEKKPSSAPASTARTYKKFSFLDDDEGGLDPPLPNKDNTDDSLDNLLDDLEHKERPKTMKKTESPSSSSPSILKKTETASPAASVKKRDDLTFDGDEDDLIDALGFGETPKVKGNGLTQKQESDPPRRARTRLDEILGRGTSPRLMERPITGEKKDTRQTEKQMEKLPEKSSAGKASLLDEEDFTFGSYQPTMGSTPEGRQSRRQSVRFSTEDVSAHSPEHKPKPSPRATRPRADWLGLKQDEEEEEEEEEQKMEEEPKQTAKETQKPPTSPSIVPRKPSSHETPAELTATPASPHTARRQTKRDEDKEDDWLAGALSRRKTQLISQSEDREGKQEDSLALGEEVDQDTVVSPKPSISSTPRRRQEEPPALHTEPRESTGPSIQPNTSRESQHKPVSTADGGVHLTPAQTPLNADGLQQLLMQQQLSQSHLWGLGGPLNVSSQSKHWRDTDEQSRDITSLQTRIIQLEGQVRSLQLERDQNHMLLESIQQRHKQDTDLMDNMHRARVKLLEESAAQREQRSRQENEDLVERLAAATRMAEQERAELQAQHQRRLAQCQQDRDREVERLRDLQRKSILEMKKDYEDQIQRLKKLKDEEIDAVTSATSQTRSLTVVIEQMEQFSHRLGDLSCRVESTHENTAQGLELSAKHRDSQLRVLQDQLSQQQCEMIEERSRLKEVIIKMDTQLAEQQRQLEKERWRVTSEQAKAESALRRLEEERRTLTQQLSMEREELERAKSALLEEQQSVMQHCAEERRKLAAEWSRFHAQEKTRQERVEREASRALERDTHREGSIISMAKEQAELKLCSGELRQKEESLQKERESLERVREELEREKEKLSAMALRLKTRAQEVESFSKLASEQFEEGERALREARQVEAEHQTRLRNIHTQMEKLRQQEQSLQQERLKMTDHRRHVERLRHTLPVNPVTLSSAPLITDFSPAFTSTHVPAAPPVSVSPVPVELHARLALIKHTAEKDRDFLAEEQYFLDTLKKTSYNT